MPTEQAGRSTPTKSSGKGKSGKGKVGGGKGKCSKSPGGHGKGKGGGGTGKGKRGASGDSLGAKRPAGDRPEPMENVEIERMAKEHWAGGISKPFDEAVVERLYVSYLGKPIGGGRDFANKLGALELSGYLEDYLWPHFAANDPASSWAHVMSIVAMVNLKFGEGLNAWPAFHADPAKFAALFSRVVELPAERAAAAASAEGASPMTDDEHTRWVVFFVRAFQSLEDELVRAQVLRLVSLPMWYTLAPTDLAAQLAAQVRPHPLPPSPSPHQPHALPVVWQPHLSRTWKKLEKRKAKEAQAAVPPASSRHEREFVPGLLQLFLATLQRAEAGAHGEAEGGAGGEGGGRATRGVVRLLERLLELFIDLMAQLPTRRFFHAVLLDSHLLVHASLSSFKQQPQSR